MARSGTLAGYLKKRNFAITPEPKPARAAPGGHSFVVQRHWARREHFDLRLEMNGTMVSWALTRGPSADPADKRLAVKVEDHPISYNSFEGNIPKGQYGGGTVMIWDQGEWAPLVADPLTSIHEGKLKFELHGERLKGAYALVRMKTRDGGRENWLLIKERDEHVSESLDFPTAFSTSVVTGRTREQIAREGAPKKDVPGFIEPMLCRTADAPPDGAEWIHEVKYDGYRLQIAKNGDAVKLRTREGLDWTARFPAIATAAKRLKAGSLVVDGEAVVFNDEGISDFPALVDALKNAPDQIGYAAFDILFLDGADLRDKPLTERKKILAGVIPRKIKHLHLAPFSKGNGAKRFSGSKKSSMEGIVSKRADSRYRSGRGTSWIKSKHNTREDVVIVGFVPSLNGRKFGALVSAVEDGEHLAYSGRIGTGFNERELDDISRAMKAIERSGPPPNLRNAKLAPRGTHWVEPVMRAEVAMSGWTGDRQLRHPRFLAMRDQPAPVAAVKTVRRAVKSSSNRKSSAKIEITNGDRIVFPDAGVTKAQIADYYDRAAERIMPHLKGRPVSFLRAPESIEKETFFQRHPLNGMRGGITRIPDPAGKHDDFLLIDDASGLRLCAQFGVIELHGWGCTLPKLDRPDRVVFDLDPDEVFAFGELKDAARHLKSVLEDVDLESFPLLSGGKGVHVVVPLDRSQDWDTIELFAKGMARGLARADPARFIATMSKSRRKGKIYIDWLRNKITATAIVPWSLRARKTASIAVPVSWEKLAQAKSPGEYTIGRLPASDHWTDFFKVRQKIPSGAIDFLKSTLG